MVEEEGTGAGQGFRPSQGTKYIVGAVGAHSPAIELKEKGQIVVFGSDKALQTPGNIYFLRDSATRENLDISGVMGFVYLGDDSPVVVDCSMQGLFIPGQLSRALRDEPSFFRSRSLIDKLFNGGSIQTPGSSQVADLLLKQVYRDSAKRILDHEKSGVLYWEYRRDPNSVTGEFLPKVDPVTKEVAKTASGSPIPQKFLREQVAWYDLSSIFHKAKEQRVVGDLVEVVLAKPNNPNRRISIKRLEQR